MNKVGWIIYCIEIGISVILTLVDYRWTTGFILGALVSVFLYFRNNSFWNDVLDTKVAGKRTGTSHFAINYLIMAITLIVCAKNQGYLNVIACALGIMSIKWAIVLQTIVSKE